MGALIKINVDGRFYIRDPLETELGQRIIASGISLMEELGFEQFTFKKLALEISSTEASVYRYFESKNQFLQYLVYWYWNWLDFLIQYRINNIEDPGQQLQECIHVLTQSDKDDPATEYIDESALHRIIVAESARVYMTRQMDVTLRKDIYDGFGILVARLGSVVHAANARYPSPKELAMTIIITIHQQMLLQDSGARLNGERKKPKPANDRSHIVKFTTSLAFSALGI